MTKKIPDYLRLHREEPPEAPPEPAEIRGLSELCQAFRGATGWQLDYRADRSGAGGPGSGRGTGEAALGKLVLSRSEYAERAASYDDIQPLVQAIGSLVEEVHRARHVVWQREAELAAGIPVAIRADEEQHLATRLESVLRGGAEAIGCQAAALYLLDDATSHLKLRACWQLPKSRFLEKPRLLRGAVADLEALVGHAVALEDTSMLPHWKAPEDFPAALCVPVSTATTPLGTLWFFADRVREFSEEQTHMAEIIAGRLVSDLERDILVREGLHTRPTQEGLHGLAAWQRELRPSIPPLVDGWQVAGHTDMAHGLTGNYYDWCVLPDGRLAVALGHAEGSPVDAALTAATVQVALKSHAAHRHEPRQMVDRLNETLWTHSTGNRFASLLYASMDPESGVVEYASAGQIHVLLHTDGRCRPLTKKRPALGVDPDRQFRQTSLTLDPGQSLVLFTCGATAAASGVSHANQESQVAAVLQSLATATAEEQVAAVSRCLTHGECHDGTVVVVRHIA